MTTRKGSGNKPRTDLQELRQREATERQEAWSKLTPEAQLKALDSRPGESKKQRARLEALVEKHQPKPEPKGAPPVGQLITKEESGGNIKAKERRAAEQAKRRAK